MYYKTSTIKKGDWIKIVNHRFLEGCTGFVSKYSDLDDEYKIIVTKNAKGKQIKGSVWLDEDNLLLFGEHQEEEDILSMIDLALDLNDKEWFEELTKQLPLRG
jgi:hypothetical protein